MVDFGGWDMPIHTARRSRNIIRCGAMPACSMSRTWWSRTFKGEKVREFLKSLLANNVDKLKTPGRALYTCMLNSKGGVIDDLIVYYLKRYLVSHRFECRTHDKEHGLDAGRRKEFGGVTMTERPDLAMIAVQGPNAKEKVYEALGENLRETAAN